MILLFAPVFCIFAWMAWSVLRMSHLPPWRQWLPTMLLTAAACSWFLLAASDAPALWVFYLPIGIALASWAVSLRESVAAGRQPDEEPV
ncbi:hypothetical protein [Streptomyces tailanensis]|uniref:hypothetical protein n=1 Tax=Streptomyces tailanensis TaxID=2569858 RepID=UPI00122E9049|nr:hypothetical protein [Streptomyces tailanensis]